MKTRKLLAMLLSLAMVIGLMTPAAMAEGESCSCNGETHEAAIGATHYDTLTEAVAQGGEVTLLKDVNQREALMIDGNVTLDLNGNTFTSMDGGTSTSWMAVLVNRGATFTLKDDVGEGSIIASCYGIYVQPGATFNLESGTIHVAGNGEYDIGVTVWNGTFNMNGGNIEAQYGVCTSNYYADKGETDIPDSTVSVTDGTIYVTAGNDAPECFDVDDKAQITISGGIFSTDPAEWVAEDCFVISGDKAWMVLPIPERPTATVTEIPLEEVENAPPMTFALKFVADKATVDQLAYYGDWYADFELTLNNDATFFANLPIDDPTKTTVAEIGEGVYADGYLVGEYGDWGWIPVPVEEILGFEMDSATMEAGDSLKIMEYAATALDQSGVKVTYDDVYNGVQEFNCGIFFTDEYLKANPDLEVTLELRMYNPANETESYVIGETYTFTQEVPVTSVTLDKNSLSLTTGGTAQLAATVAPENASNPAVEWSSNNTNVATVDQTGKVTAVAAGSATITATAGGKSATCAVTVSAPYYGGDSSSSTPTTPSTPTVTPNTNSPTVDKDTTTNSDGSTTVTETKKDGTTVETTTNTDGSSTTTASKTEVKETSKGTTTTTATNTTTENADGSKVTEQKVEQVVEAKDGSVTATTTTTTETKAADGSKKTDETVVETVIDKNGNETTTSTTETKMDNGSTGTTTVAADGTVTAETTVTTKAVTEAAKADTAVALPMTQVSATTSTETAPTVEVNVPASVDSVKVEVPVADVTPGTVVVIVEADGTETIVPTTTLTENGVAVTLEGDATIKVVDNSKDFIDVADDYALSDSIDFVSARGLFEGTTEITYEPHANTTVAQTMTVLARLDGEDFYGAGATTKGAEWAAENGIADGTENVSAPVTRQQMVVMMWKLAGMPESDHPMTAADTHLISADALVAMQWAVEHGILKGNLDGTINPHGNASRAHVAAFAERYVNAIA